jgi:hypothetical protein
MIRIRVVRSPLLLVPALLLGVARPGAARLEAQPGTPLRGVVRDSASGEAVPGAVVLALGARGDTVARGVTREDGGFALVPRAPAQRLQLLRLGFRPRVVPLDGRGDAVAAVALVRLPTLLGRVEVRAAQCRSRPDREEAAALLEQARAGLLAMQVAYETSPAAVTRLAYLRQFAADGRTVARQQVRVDSGTASTASFGASRTGAEFVRLGFRQQAQGDQLLYGPDAQVLLDPGFAAGYCFHRAPDDPARPTEVGVAFEPARRARDRVDIEGALWIDTLARAVTGIAFRYAGVEEAAARAGAGGAVAFRPMPSGVVLIDRWWLRTLGPPSIPAGGDRRDAPPSAPVLTEVGGALARAAWPDGARWDAPLGTVQLTARTPTGARAGGVMVGLRDSDYRGVADVDGGVQLERVLPGPYEVVVLDSALAALGVAIPTGATVLVGAGDTARLTVEAPSADAYLRAACGAGAPHDGAILAARVVTAEGNALAGVSWGVRRSRGGSWRVVAERGRTDADGRLQLCEGVAEGDVIELRLTRDAGAPETIVQTLNAPITAVPVVFHDEARRAGEETPGGTLLSGVVRAPEGGAPVAEARLSLVGTLLEAVTDSSGEFLLGGIPRGDYQLEVRTPWMDSIGAVHRAAVRISGERRRMAVTMPSAAALLAASCGTRRDGGALVGRIVSGDAGGRGGRHRIRVTASWRDRAVIVMSSGEVFPRLRWVEAQADSAGTYRLCGVPVGTDLSLTAMADEAGAPGETPSAPLPADTLPAPGARPVTLRVAATRPVARVDVALDSAVVGPASFAGVLLDPNGAPVPFVEVRLPVLGRAVLANEGGRFRLEGIPPGTHQVTITREGFAPLAAQVPFAANRLLEHRIVLTPPPVD